MFRICGCNCRDLRSLGSTCTITAALLLFVNLKPAVAANTVTDEAGRAERSTLPLPIADNEVRVTSLFHVGRRRPQVLDTSGEALTEGEWDIDRHTQLVYLKSEFLIQGALRVPGMESLRLLDGQPDKVAWLIDHLECGFERNSEVLYVSLRGPENRAEDLRKLVDAVSEAYLKEIVFEDEQRVLVIKDALQRVYSTMQDEIRQKLETRTALARDLGLAEYDGSARVMQQVDLQRLERIDTELLRLESEQLGAKLLAEEKKGEMQPKERAQLRYFVERIAQLRDAQAELEKRITGRGRSSLEFEAQDEELATLQSIARDVNRRLEMMEIESVAPDRTRRIQKATIKSTSSAK